MENSPSSICTALQRPATAARKINEVYFGRIQKGDYNPEGASIFNKDWDNLIILDACRYDMFQQVSSLPGNTKKRVSLASATPEWVEAEFSDRELYDTVYITINSYYTQMKSNIQSDVHSLIDVQQMDLPDEAYDNDFDIPHPSVVTDYAIEAFEKYPNKRIIVHHNVPHYPYLSDFGRKTFTTPSSSLQDAIKEKDSISRKNLIQAYKENIEIGIKEAKSFYSNTDGKTVITADHGEMLGERYRFIPMRGYGHPRGIYLWPLTNVPWHILPFDSRKNIKSEYRSETHEHPHEKKIEQNLRRLGYL